MKRDDAIHIVDVAFNIPLAVRRAGEDRTYHEAEIREAKRMAIAALSQEQQSEWERDHEILKAYADGQESMKPCKDAVSIKTVKEQMIKYGFLAPDMTVTEFVEDLPSVSTEKTERWIPVSEKLPEDDCETYLVCTDKGYIATIMYDRSMGWLLDANIIAYMPLPQPYKAESEDKE